MNRPVIGITVPPKAVKGKSYSHEYAVADLYVQALVVAGASPVVIPTSSDPASVAPLLDGWLIPGGNDFDGCHLGEPTHPKANIEHPERFPMERALLDLVDQQMPILGICYGSQFLTVANGGKLEQHMPDRLGVEETHSSGTKTLISVSPNSLLARCLGSDQVEGRCYHHQAVLRPAPGYAICATAPDKTIEAVESTDGSWIIGLQWHPERSMEDPVSQRLFKNFVSACREFKESK
jgi:putative glutamine amidotransferase